MIGPLQDQLDDARKKNKDLLDENKKLKDDVNKLLGDLDDANKAGDENKKLKFESYIFISGTCSIN